MENHLKMFLDSLKLIMDGVTIQLEPIAAALQKESGVVFPETFYAASVKKRLLEAMAEHPFYANSPELSKEIISYIGNDHTYAVIELSGAADSFVENFANSLLAS